MSAGTPFKVVTRLVDPSDPEIRDTHLEAKEEYPLKGFKKLLTTVRNHNRNWRLDGEVRNLNRVSL